MAKPKDDLEAVRIVAETLEQFTDSERERIVRWALEKLGTALPTASAPSDKAASLIVTSGASKEHVPAQSTHEQTQTSDIKSFVDLKNPSSNIQLAVVVAYYYRFEAPSDQRKDSINKDDLKEAIRLTDRTRTTRPDTVLVNAFNSGYFDRTGDAGQYAINAVGENLVAMALPSGSEKAVKRPRKKKSSKPGVNKKSVTVKPAKSQKKPARRK